ncbi:MAG: cadherin domain-containing protein [Sphingomonas adhaesiva]|uniref:cadherin domain-containing protein n=1 Tax=Sphingomonas adhaesiva TaxID=28212 RepID=UPI002FFD2E0F
MSTTSATGTNDADNLDLRFAAAAMTVDAGAGDDYVLGSRFDDYIDGGAGSDRLSGGAGEDTIRGGQGSDRVSGGVGSDTFLFLAGDLMAERGQADQVVDFTGAGTSGTGDQDVLRFEGFGAGSTLSFVQYGANRVQVNGAWTLVENQAMQYYRVIDPTNAANNGYILVQTSGGTQRLTAADYLFVIPQATNSAPTAITLDNNAIVENAGSGTIVGKLAATDADANDTVAFSLTGDAGGAFAIGADGATIVATRSFDYEGGPRSFDLTVRATDKAGATFDKVVTIAVTDANDAPSAITLSRTTVAENKEEGTFVGYLSATDADANDIVSFSLVDDAGGAFALGTNKAGFMLNTTRAFDYEAGPKSYDVTVRATDKAGATFDKVLTIAVGDVDEAPVAGALSTRTVANADGTTSLELSLTAKDLDSTAVQAIVDWGGTKETVTLTAAGDGTFGGTVSRVMTPGVTAVSVTMTDGVNTTASQTVSVNVGAKDAETSKLERIGASSGGGTYILNISPDGTKVLFSSPSPNYVSGDDNGAYDVFVKDLISGVVTAVSSDAQGKLGNRDSTGGQFSSDGSKVLFGSEASNFSDDHKGNFIDFFVKDLKTGRVSLVSSDDKGQSGNADADQAVMSPDGKKVVFSSYASNLVSDDKNSVIDIFIKDLETETIKLVTSSSDGVHANSVSNDWILRISEDGSRVIFDSYADTLVAGDENRGWDIFAKDVATGETVAVSVGPDGKPAGGTRASISNDGNLVVFQTNARLVESDTNNFSDTYVRDLRAGQTYLVSTNQTGQVADRGGISGVISPDGNKVAFISGSTNMGVDNRYGQIFIKDLRGGDVSVVSVSNGGELAKSVADIIGFSSDSSKLIFTSSANNIAPGTRTGILSIFVKDLATGQVTLVSGADDGAAATSSAIGRAYLSADNSHIAFMSTARNLVPGDTNNVMDVFVRSLPTGATVTGTDGADVLVGTKLSDTLTGGAGADVLRGGAGADRFVFEIGHGVDRIEDFGIATADVVVLKGFGPALDSFAEVMAAATQVGADTVIATGAGSSITLLGVARADLKADDFYFG